MMLAYAKLLLIGTRITDVIFFSFTYRIAATHVSNIHIHVAFLDANIELMACNSLS